MLAVYATLVGIAALVAMIGLMFLADIIVERRRTKRLSPSSPG